MVSFECYLTFVVNCCSLSMIFGNVSQHLEKGKQFQEIFVTKCCVLNRQMVAKQGSKEEIPTLNAVAKALKASSMKALRDFRRCKFGMPSTLFGTHYNRI